MDTSKAKNYADFKLAAEELELTRPSVLRYTPMLWTLKWVLKILSFIALLLFISTFITSIWDYMHTQITGVELQKEESVTAMVITTQASLLMIIALSWLGYQFTRLAIRRNYYILNQHTLLWEVLDHLKVNEDTPL